ncbi:hypothetical protein KQX54_010669 [Cotesia glomerata]|uniref:Uncharacterized protein n=1 Tax=Cotesia glomerata TaxID=32391 RepID=A0AAV7INM3_COTGL|nr:hypothetical protein KQX54_010669 [Cotesia glomerata]
MFYVWSVLQHKLQLINKKARISDESKSARPVVPGTLWGALINVSATLYHPPPSFSSEVFNHYPILKIMHCDKEPREAKYELKF